MEAKNLTPTCVKVKEFGFDTQREEQANIDHINRRRLKVSFKFPSFRQTKSDEIIIDLCTIYIECTVLETQSIEMKRK